MATVHPPIFHHAFTVCDLEATRHFYSEVLGLRPARRARHDASVDYDFFGHHIIAHLASGQATAGSDYRTRHFGVVLDWQAFEHLAGRLRAKGVTFLVAPHVRHGGEPREEALMMLQDPSGNAIEFKTFRDIGHLFGTAESVGAKSGD
jgi:extradiol dioxygenase family protein